jgi:aminoglycoside/choline kinase family phosphotransferase
MSEQLKTLFLYYTGELPTSIKTLQAHASDRKIYRLFSADNKSVIGVENENIIENKAFIYFSYIFEQSGLPVPKIYSISDDYKLYLEQDLGDTTLFNKVQQLKTSPDDFPKELEDLYTRVIALLPVFQIKSAKNIDYSKCAQEQEFKSEVIRRDMEFFKKAFLEKVFPNFDATKLNSEFDKLTTYLDKYPRDYFMYRDFQSRNVMIYNDSPWFIDYQGGRKGPLQYDVASMLYQASTQIPQVVKNRLIEVYLDAANELIPINRISFKDGLSGFILVRMLQVLGTYGKQGLEQGKSYFLESIPRAVSNLVNISNELELIEDLPELKRICYHLPEYVKQYKN